MMRRSASRWFLLALLIAPLACSAPDEGAASSDRPHGNHDPKHGGLVLMDRDLHFEVVVRPPGEYRLYFTDEIRKDLPASVASDVVLAVTQWNEKPETVTLQPDAGGGNWFGKGPEVHDPDATLRVSYVYRGKPYFIDLPFKHVQNPPAHAEH